MKNRNVVTKQNCHSQVSLLGIFRVLSRYAYKEKILFIKNSYVEDPRQNSSGMTPLFNNGGFTLIELLVVVLIIGILAAVAVPQYQRAIEKSKATQALTLLKSLAQATQSYYLANGKYPTKFEQLDVDMTAWTGNTQVHIGHIQDTKSNEDWSLQLWSNDSGNSIMIMILRTSGKYKAAGFVISGFSKLPSSPACVEDSVVGFPSSQEGTYCEKLFNGTVKDPTNDFRQYELPF